MADLESTEAQLNVNKTKEKWMMLKNVLIISSSFMVLFTAFQSLASLQSSINRIEGLGTYSLSVLYAFLVASSMFLPSILITALTVKWTMVFSMLCYSVYIIAQFYPEFYTLIPGAIILGIGAAPMWSAKCTYLTQIANKYAEFMDIPVEPVIVRFFGIFFLFFQSSSVFGNLISSAILSSGTNQTEAAIKEDSNEIKANCGLDFCPAISENSSNFEISDSSRYKLLTVFLACSVISVLKITFLVDPLTLYGEKERNDKKAEAGNQGFSLFISTFLHMKNKHQLLLIPITFWSGLEQGFFGADFTAGFVSCVIGVHNVGYVLILYGICDAICSFSFGYVIKYVGRAPIFVFGAIVNYSVILVFFLWSPSKDGEIVLYVLAALWGMADAVWQTQINALYGVLFEGNEEPAFANYRLWESFGFIIAYILNVNVCTVYKVWFMVCVLSLGMVGYMAIEVIQRLNNVKEKNNVKSS